VRNEALWIVYNVLSTNQTQLIRKLIDSKIITTICQMGEEIYKCFNLNNNLLHDNSDIQHFVISKKSLNKFDKAGKIVNLIHKCVMLSNKFAKTQKDFVQLENQMT